MYVRVCAYAARMIYVSLTLDEGSKMILVVVENHKIAKLIYGTAATPKSAQSVRRLISLALIFL